ncbi:AAA family ATPase [Bacillus sp. 31A1R]|uniref:AAA family ATPase n=1 Tax=Robertmurraya mangrovi TaxID=3098077 RepID=A0ABU5ISS7_9BACI|nr:AAA family ATPase [Bacillus sp. 31A1R]MDZ5470197.1 AAA family ATPase [Bacillus sp. 31A1R]
MKLEEIHIYGYGRLEDVSIKSLGDFQVFYGQNEAGKSTIMSFIHSILFGFPTKQQSDLRYEPKKGTKYGGKLVVTSKQGRATIERVKGKAVGDVSVWLDDGTIGGEELLKEILSSIDKSLYQSIFSFNLHGLQNVHHMKSEDLGKFLFSTGALGSDRLLTVDAELQKELELRFKPNGKKPLINEKLKEIKDVYNELKRTEQMNARYNQFLQEKESLHKEIYSLNEKINRLEKMKSQLEEWEKLSPIVKESLLLKEELDQTKKAPYPVDGISRLDQINQVITPLTAQMKTIKERIRSITDEIKANEPNYHLIENETVITAATEKMPLYDSILEQLNEWELKKQQLEEEIRSIREKLHIPINEENIVNVNTSIFMKEKTASAQKKQQRLNEKKEELEELFNSEKAALEMLEGRMEQIKNELLPKSEREKLEENVANIVKQESLNRDLQEIQEKIQFYKKSREDATRRKTQNFRQGIMFGFIFTLLIGFGIWKTELLLSAFGAVGIIYVFSLLFKNNQLNELKDLDKKIKLCLRQEEELKQKANINLPNYEWMEKQLRRDKELQEQLTLLHSKWSLQNEQYERVIKGFEKWELEVTEHETFLINLGDELFLPKEIALRHLHEAFLLIEKLKHLISELHRMDEQIKKRQNELLSITSKIDELKQKFLKQQNYGIKESALLLKEQLKEELEKYNKYSELKKKLNELEEECIVVESDFKHINEEKQELFKLANVETEEEFRIVGQLEEKRKSTLARLHELNRNVQLSSLSEDTITFYLDKDANRERQILLNELSETQEKRSSSIERLAEVKHEISVIEDGGTYAETLHTYKQLTFELEEEAREWATYMVAKEVMSKTVQKFKEERLPNMLKKAESYLQYLTDGQYVRIITKQDSNGFLIERKDQTLFEANELSQATTEQVYVSLRLALATTVYKKFPFPIIIDDSFVNFDHVRTEKVINLLKEMTSNQILFFTCHKHLLTYFTSSEIIHLEKSKIIPIQS